jgi:hypothetical protein
MGRWVERIDQARPLTSKAGVPTQAAQWFRQRNVTLNLLVFYKTIDYSWRRSLPPRPRNSPFA